MPHDLRRRGRDIPRKGSVKIFHDDNRFPPDDTWEWAKDNATAIALLQQGECTVISIDMDLGAVEGKDFKYGREVGYTYRGLTCKTVDWLRNMNDDPGENGIDLATEMVKLGLIPPRIIIHTWNGWGGEAIAKVFREAGHHHPERHFWSQSFETWKRVYDASPAVLQPA